MSRPTRQTAAQQRLGRGDHQTAERGLRAEINKSRAEQWWQNNHEALTSSNEYVEQHGLPLADYRRY
jgi:antitoxin CcdA